ncbi:MAG: GTPase HflX, partial [Alphaproteobacteria bacterium]|nr:GTPase HflX [Alphaproteobacteria bacterium]
GITPEQENIIEILNKIDLLPENIQKSLLEKSGNMSGPVAISALTGSGLTELLRIIAEKLDSNGNIVTVMIDPADGAGLAWAYRHGRVLSRHDSDVGVKLSIAVDPSETDRFVQKFYDSVIRT